MSTYIRCTYIPDGGIQCDNWIKDDIENKKCVLHTNHISASLAAANENKTSYIEIRNNEAKLCHLMSMEELEAHIASLELVIEQEKAKLYSARATRTDKLDKLSDEEREVRRKIKVEKAIEASTPKKATIKSDPIRFFMEKYSISEADAKAKLGL